MGDDVASERMVWREVQSEMGLGCVFACGFRIFGIVQQINDKWRAQIAEPVKGRHFPNYVGAREFDSKEEAQRYVVNENFASA